MNLNNRYQAVSAALLLAAFSLSAMTPKTALAGTVGAIPGQFAVSESGAATYTIPIEVPPGTAGMEPKLSLSYNSQGGNGLLGIGWSLSGLSAITRCPRTFVQDSINAGVDYSTNDKYCLDGQRLVMVSTGTYGANGMEYRTEMESFVKVISYSTAGNGPAWFKVWTKSGQIMEFGNTTDSRIEAQGKTTVAVWGVNKISDTKGNYLTVTYTEDNANGQFYPKKIDYTGNSITGMAPYNSVQFSYGTRSHIIPGYHAGSLSQTTVSLVNIKTQAGSTLLAEYRLNYTLSQSPVYTHLANIEKCASDGKCLKQTQFWWGIEPSQLFDETLVLDQWCNQPVIFGDFNGDGKSDRFCRNSGDNNSIGLSNGDGTFGATLALGQWCNQPVQLADFNGDGLSDRFCQNSGDNNSVSLSNGDGTFGPTVALGTWCNRPVVLADINGDGRTDRFCRNSGDKNSVSLSNGDGTFGATIDLGVWCNQGVQLADFNGDGKADRFCKDSSDNNSVSFSNGDGTFGSTISLGVWCNKPVVFGDINGDGKTDRFCRNSASENSVSLSKGDGTFGSTIALGSWCNQAVQLADFNGDGKADRFCRSSGDDNSVSISNGDGTFGTTINLGDFCNQTVVLTDINGDGRDDRFCRNSGDNNSVILANMALPHSLTSISNGLGDNTMFNFKPLTDNSIYSRDDTAIYPYRDLQFPLYVVSDVTNGIGSAAGSSTTNYTYAGAKSHLQGRGFLGFRSVESNNEQTNITSQTDYRQDFPYIGLPTLIEKSLNNGQRLINRTTTTYSLITAGSGTSLRNFPYAQQSDEESYDLGGSLITRTTTTQQFDSYGNPTQIVVNSNDGYSKTTVNTYNTADTTNWILGRLKRATVTSTTP